MKILRTPLPVLLLVIILFGFFFSLLIVHAGEVKLVPCSGSECTACKLFGLANNIVQFLILIAISIATISIVWAGFLLISAGGDSGKVTKAKSVFVNVLIGIIIALTGFLIVDTIVRSLTNYSLKSLQNLSCQPQTPIQGKYNPVSRGVDIWEGAGGTGSSGGTGGTVGTSGVSAGNEAEVRAKLAALNIGVNKGACPQGARFQSVSGGCTSVGGLNESTITGLARVQQACGCRLIVNGGSELGHSTHKDGTNVDLPVGASTNAYINGQLQSGATNIARNARRQVSRFTDSQGNRWIREGPGFSSFANTTGPHWHVTFK